MKTLPLTFSPFQIQRGVTMVEVLIAAIILSVGLLGVASLQGMSKQSSYQSYQRTVAMNLVDGIIERIRANPTAAASYHTGLSSPLGGATITTEPSPDCSANICSAAQLAAYDLWQFEQSIDGTYITTDAGSNNVGGLLNPQACIVFAAASGKTNTGRLNVILSWEGMEDISDAATTAAEACGGASANSDASRRQVILNVYLVDGSEL